MTLKRRLEGLKRLAGRLAPKRGPTVADWLQYHLGMAEWRFRAFLDNDRPAGPPPTPPEGPDLLAPYVNECMALDFDARVAGFADEEENRGQTA